MKQLVPFVDHEVGHRLLHKLIEASKQGLYSIPAVITTSNNNNSWWPSVTDLCIQADIPLLEYETTTQLDQVMRQADWVLLVSWKHIIPQELIYLPRRGILNLHYSLLPSYRGVYPVNWALINGEEKTGFTYHFVNEEIDDGAIFMQHEVPIMLSDTARSLQLRIDDCVCDHFDDLIRQLMEHDLPSFTSAPNHSINNKSAPYYSRKKFKEVCSIAGDNVYAALDFLNILRGLTFFADSHNAYIVDKRSGKKVYISISLTEEP